MPSRDRIPQDLKNWPPGLFPPALILTSVTPFSVQLTTELEKALIPDKPAQSSLGYHFPPLLKEIKQRKAEERPKAKGMDLSGMMIPTEQLSAC